MTIKYIFTRTNCSKHHLIRLLLLIISTTVCIQSPAQGKLTLEEKLAGAEPTTRHTIELTAGQKIAAQLPSPPIAPLIPIPEPPADGPWPNKDPRDLSGTWIHTQRLELMMRQDMYGHLVPYTEKGANVLARRVNSNNAGKPFINASAICRPPGQPFQLDLHFAFQIFQSEEAIEFVFREFHGRWLIALDPDFVQEGPSYMGHSVAQWVGDTLVVEITNFKKGIWLDPRGTPLSKDGKLTARIRKVTVTDTEYFLEIITTVEDPHYYTKPWSFVRTYGWRPNMTLFDEYNCEEQLGDPNVPADAGLISEEE